MKRLILVFFVGITLVGCRSTGEANVSNSLSVSYAPNSPRLVGVVIDPDGSVKDQPTSDYSEIQNKRAVICAYEWMPGMKANTKVSPLNKNSLAYSPAKAGQIINFEWRTAFAGTFVMSTLCAFVKPCKAVLGLVATAVVAVRAAQVGLGENEARENGWPMLTSDLDARWSEGQYNDLKRVVSNSGNTDFTCNPVEADLLHRLEMEACANQAWTCPGR